MGSMSVSRSVLNVKAQVIVSAFNQEKALVGAFSVIEKPVVEPMDRFVALLATLPMPPAPLSSAVFIRNNISRQFVVCRELLKSK